MIVVRAAERPGGWDLLAATLAALEREGAAGEVRHVIVDNADLPNGLAPEGWLVHRHRGPRGARATLWAALELAACSPRPVLILEDDLLIARGGLARMLAADFAGCALCSFFYPRYARASERFTRARPVPGYEERPIISFGWTQAVTLTPSAVAHLLDAGYWPAPASGGPHGGDFALRDALMHAGYQTFRLLWPNPVDHTGCNGRAAIVGHRPMTMHSGWFADAPFSHNFGALR